MSVPSLSKVNHSAIVFVGVLWIGSLQARGHVILDAPNGGEVLAAGSVFTVEWRIQITHNQLNWDLWYSTTGDTGPWVSIAQDLPPGSQEAGSVHTYDWTVPDDPSNQVRIRVRMDNSGTDYEDTSDGDLTIETGPPTGACCFGNGFCTPQTQENCESTAGQVYLGNGIECVGDMTCPAVCWSCSCVDGSSTSGQSAVGCVAEESACDASCQALGGTQSFQCDLGPCLAVPTVSQWGLIVMTLLILTGTTLVLARRGPGGVSALSQ